MPRNSYKDATRRLATIMAADIVGYSRLMDSNEEGTYAALRSARSEVIDPKIAKHKGRIVKHTGDGFLAEFPTVMAAVNFAMDCRRKLRAGQRMSRKILKVKFRIGINLGDIIVDDSGDIFDGNPATLLRLSLPRMTATI